MHSKPDKVGLQTIVDAKSELDVEKGRIAPAIRLACGRVSTNINSVLQNPRITSANSAICLMGVDVSASC